MIISLLKNAKPMTRRQNIWFGIFCLSCIAITGVLVAYNLWANDSIETQLTNDGATDISIRAIYLGCSPQYYWGHDVILTTPNGVRASRVVCRDWKEQRWYPAGGL